MAGHQDNGTPSAGAVRAVAAVYTKYGDFIRAVIRFQAQNEFLEEDLFQEFFLSLVAKPIPVNVFNLRSYLYRAVTHFVVECRRRQTTYERCLGRHAEEIRNSVNNKVVESALFETEAMDAAFRRWTCQMRRREAEAFWLRYREDFSIGEIARAMGVSRRTVSHYLWSGLKRLRRLHAIE